MMKKLIFVLLSLCLFSLFFIVSHAYTANDIPTSKVLVEPNASAKPLVTSIDHAKSTIELSIYSIFDPSGIEDSVAQALVRAKQHGVVVHILLNNFTDSTYPNNLEILNEENLWCNSNKMDCRFSSTAFTYSHEKYIIIDNQKAFIMTMNLAPEDFNNTDDSARNFIYITTYNQDIDFLNQLFTIDWNNVTKYTKNNPEVPLHFVLSPVDSNEKIETFVNNDATEDSLKEIDMYEMELKQGMDNHIVEEIVKDVQQGVTVKLITNASNSLVDPEVITVFKKAGVQVIQTNDTGNQMFIHAKVIIRTFKDGKKEMMLGSNNMSWTSMNQNREVSIIDDHALDSNNTAIDTVQKMFHTDWENWS